MRVSSPLKPPPLRRKAPVLGVKPAHEPRSLVAASQTAVPPSAVVELRTVLKRAQSAFKSAQVSERVGTPNVRDSVGPLTGAVGRARRRVVPHLPSAVVIPVGGGANAVASARQGGAPERVACARTLQLFKKPA